MNIATKSETAVSRKFGFFSDLILKYGVLIATIAVFIYFSFMQSRFFTPRNIFNLIGQGSIIGMLALGMTLVVITGSFDISFAHVAALGACLSVRFVGGAGITPGLGLGLYQAWLLVAAISVGFCLFDGVATIYFRVPGIIVSFGMMGVLLGLSLWVTDGSLLYYSAMPDGFASIGRTLVFGFVPPPLILFILASAIMVFLVEITYLGRYFYAVGINAEASHRAGINVKKMRLLAYGIMGIPTALIIDQSGQIVWRGHPGSFDLEANIDKLLNDK